MFHVKQMDQIIYELKVLNKNMEKVIGLLQLEETTPPTKNKRSYKLKKGQLND